MGRILLTAQRLMERTERLLDLVALLLDAKEPLTWKQIRAAFPEDYGTGSFEATERKFERDKAELLELGIPISYVQADEDKEDGYVIDREAYYLPKLELNPEEMAVLYAAGSAALASGAFPGSTDLAHALRKIGFFAGPKPPAPKVRLELGGVAEVRDLPARLDTLWQAIGDRKFVEISYWSPKNKQQTRRRVDPYGLALRRGLWSLVGWCHLRNGIRTFHVHRVRELTVNAKNPKTPDYEMPKDFALDDYVASFPWQHRFHDRVDVDVSLAGPLTELAGNLFPGSPTKAPGQVTVSATDLDGLLRFVLSLGADARVLGPPEAVRRHAEMAEAVAKLHPEKKENG
jgi:proteasome accessory factor B